MDASSRVEALPRQDIPLPELCLTAVDENGWGFFAALVNYKHNQRLQRLFCASVGVFPMLMHAAGREQTSQFKRGTLKALIS